MKKQSSSEPLLKQLDLFTTLIPFIGILSL